MISCTDAAADLIRSLVDRAGLDDSAGLRFGIDPTWRSLAIGLAALPESGDDVLTHRGVRVFVGPAAGGRLQGQTLDALVADRTERFFLTPSR